MQSKQQYEAEQWIHGYTQSNGQLAAEWMLPIPDELILTAEEVE